MEKRITEADALLQNLQTTGENFIKAIDEFAILLETTYRERAMQKFNAVLFWTTAALISITILIV